jgi:hypothetical protein
MQPDDVDGVTIIRGKAGKVVLTLDPRGMRLTHPWRSYAYDVAWSDIEEVKVVDHVKAMAPGPVTRWGQIASFRLKQTDPGFFARLKRRLTSSDEFVMGDFDQSPQELVDLIERYRVRHAGPE